MLRRFVRHSLTYGLSAVVIRLVAFAVVPIYTRAFSPDDYGTLDMLTVFGTLVWLTVSLELPQGILRFFPDATTDDERTRIASTGLLSTCVMYVAFIVVNFLVAEQVSTVLFGTSAESDLVRVAGFTIASGGLFLVLQAQMRAQFSARTYGLAGIAFALSGALVAVVLVTVFSAGVAGVLVGQVIGALVGASVVVLAGRSYYRLLIDQHVLRELLRFSAPLVISSVAVFAATYLDRFAIRSFLSLSDVGVYAVGVRVAAMASILTIAVQTALVPLIYERRGAPGFDADLARLFRLYVAGSGILIAALAVLSRPIVSVLAPPDYAAAAQVVPILTAAALVATAYAFFPGLAVAKRTVTIAAVSIAGASANVFLLLLLVPTIGILGGAIATLLVAGGVLIATAVLSHTVMPIDHGWPAIASICIATGGSVVLLALASALPYAAFAALGAVAVLGVALLCWLAGLVRIDDLTLARAGMIEVRDRWSSRSEGK